MFFKQFGLLFSNMEWFILVCFLVGVVFLLIELIEPGFGFFGISGLILLVASVVLRAIFREEEDLPIVQAFQFILLDIIIFGIVLIFLGIAHKKGWLKKTPFFHTGTAVDEKYSAGNKNYDYILNKEGTAITILRPSGKIEIDGEIYDAESTGFLIEKGAKICVVKLDGSIIKVEKIKKQKQSNVGGIK